MKKQIKEGTWAVGTKDQFQHLLNDLDKIQKHYFEIIGDDEVWNGVDSASRRVKELMDFHHPTGKEIPATEIKNKKMKTSELTELVKKIALEEAKEDEKDELEDLENIDDEAIEDINVDDTESIEDEAPEDTGLEGDSTAEYTGDEKEVQDHLQAALETAKSMGDEKLVDQIGNTITFFTRTHIVKEDDNLPEEAIPENEENIFESRKWNKMAGLITD